MITITGISLLILIAVSGWSAFLYRSNLRLSRRLEEAWKLNMELKEMEKKLAENYRQMLVINNLGVAENERRKIGNDLHDFMGSMLWATKVQLGLAVRKGNPNVEGITAITKATEIIDETMQNTKSVIQHLVPKTLLTEGLSEAILEHCERISSDTMQVDFTEHGEPFFRRSNDNKLIILFRVVQELLNNCVKYSNATCIHVSLNWGAQLIISMTNNGKPFQMDSCLSGKSNGIGTLTITERVAILKGMLTTEAGPPNTLVLEIPYK